MTMTTNGEFGFRFREWDIYKDARDFRTHIYGLIKNYPAEERYAPADQSRRAVSSIVLNIAEGANRNSDKDTRVFINRAHTSLDEVVACLDCALDSGYITSAQHQDALTKAASLARRLRSFSNHLSSS